MTTQTPPTPVIGAIRAEMARRGVTQVQLGKGIGLSQPSLSARLRGLTPFKVTEVMAIAAFLGVPAASLFADEVAA